MTFKDFKNLDYPGELPLEIVLSQVMYEGLLDINLVLSAYAHSIEKDRHESKMRFEEACVCLTQQLSGNYNKKDDRTRLNKRMISILNRSQTLPHHIYDKEYGFTEDDEKEWDDFYKTIYGRDITL